MKTTISGKTNEKEQPNPSASCKPTGSVGIPLFSSSEWKSLSLSSRNERKIVLYISNLKSLYKVHWVAERCNFGV